MSAAGKYLAASDQTGYNGWHEFSKPGYFTSESEIVRGIREVTGTEGCRHPIAYFVEAADDIVYCSVDLEDGIKRGALVWDQVEEKLREKAPGSTLLERVLTGAKKHAEPLKLERKSYCEALAQAFRIAAISEMAVAARRVFKKRYAAIMQGEYHEELLMDPDSEARPVIEACKYVLRSDLYRHPEILRLEVRGREVIHDLLEFFWETVKDYDRSKQNVISPKSYDGKLYFLLSDNYRRGFEKRINDGIENELYCKLQLITDQVAGMTDTHACEIHKRLTNN
jgi:dGTPase